MMDDRIEYCGEVAAQDRAKVREILDANAFRYLEDWSRMTIAIHDLIEEIRMEAEVGR